jgi:hypothetical protein
MQYESTTIRSHRTIDLTGRPFGLWTVTAFAGTYQGNTYWTCQCTCGAVSDVAAHALRRGTSNSCGCQKPEISRQLHTTHGMSSSVEHAIRRAMIQRCTNPNHQDYPLYGGRGITVCEAWRTSFEAFYADMGPRPSPHHTLERLQNDKPYEPGNVVWDTPATQARNRRSTVLITHEGITLCITDWALRVGMKQHTLAKRLREGWSVAEALTIPVSKTHTHLHRS